MMSFDAFRRRCLDHRVATGDVMLDAAHDMAHAYRMLTEDPREQAKADAFIKELQANRLAQQMKQLRGAA